jgi:4-hydroxy-2-oxoheptanedioate aldolase
MEPNQAKKTLKAGGTVIGTYVRHADAGLAEILCYLGFDYLLFDGEHAPIGERECENLARVCELTGVTSIARVPSNQGWMIGRHLDMGIQGIQVPMVNTGAEARAAARAAKYAPLGTRGLAGARAANYAQVLPFSHAEHVAKSNAETMVIAQVETREAIRNLADIVATPGIDVVFIGPTDLSLSLGHPGEFGHPEVQAAFDEITSVVLKSDKVLGVLAANTEASLEWRARGARYIMSVLESIMGPAVRDYLKAVRAV